MFIVCCHVLAAYFWLVEGDPILKKWNEEGLLEKAEEKKQRFLEKT